MTPYQVRRVLFHPRREDGTLDRREKPGEARTLRDYIIERWMRWGLPRHRAEMKWEEYLKEHPPQQHGEH